jgi:hypothetical protein
MAIRAIELNRETTMRPTERPLTFEQEYPKHAFAPLVDLGMTIAAWVVRRRAGMRAESASASPRPIDRELRTVESSGTGLVKSPI